MLHLLVLCISISFIYCDQQQGNLANKLASDYVFGLRACANRQCVPPPTAIGVVCTLKPTLQNCCNWNCVNSLKWYTTCAGQVGATNCAYVCNAASTLCPSGIQDGVTTCESYGSVCNLTSTGCPACTTFECSTSDPKLPYGCPISKRDKKKHITYVSEEEKKEHFRQIMSMDLATYQYKWDDDGLKSHLGFIIDDVPNPTKSYAISADGNSVDMYGYASMLVSTVQMQGKMIAELRDEISRLREDIKSLRKV